MTDEHETNLRTNCQRELYGLAVKAYEHSYAIARRLDEKVRTLYITLGILAAMIGYAFKIQCAMAAGDSLAATIICGLAFLIAGTCYCVALNAMNRQVKVRTYGSYPTYSDLVESLRKGYPHEDEVTYATLANSIDEATDLVSKANDDSAECLKEANGYIRHCIFVMFFWMIAAIILVATGSIEPSVFVC